MKKIDKSTGNVIKDDRKSVKTDYDIEFLDDFEYRMTISFSPSDRMTKILLKNMYRQHIKDGRNKKQFSNKNMSIQLPERYYPLVERGIKKIIDDISDDLDDEKILEYHIIRADYDKIDTKFNITMQIGGLYAIL